ncbi:VWA domain-containing protein [Marinomonas sp. FW-1]|uniref:VWA domain-containing protein n=1 Tax=Marinomonas sp. FW-1 TaxID=2071621 RepID=UPI0010C13813|nr:VWA domain-containing protein [Marinomonas sp. FW-1]
MKWLKINTVLLAAVFSFVTPFSQADTQFRVIVDASGSMLISDPDKLTSEALRLISNLAPEEEATLGVWLFGEEARVLLPESTVNQATKAKLSSYVNSYVTQDVKTDLESIIKLLLETPDGGALEPGFNRHWILVTDGMVDISLDEAVNKASRDRILNELTPQLEDRGIHLHTISMTGYTDKALLESLSLRTNASHTEVAIPEDLLDTFDRIFAQASPSDELPLDGNRFLVDEDIQELTLVVFHDGEIQPRIIRPDGVLQSLNNDSGTSVAKSDHYTLLTIRAPLAGEWTINNVDLERSSVRVITDIGLYTSDIPPVVFQGASISSTVGLLQQNTRIKDAKVLNLLNVEQRLMRLSGEQKESVFSRQLALREESFKQTLQGTIEPGRYELVSVVDGKTFSRQVSQYFTVHPAIEFKGKKSGGNLVSFTALPVNLRLDVLQSNIRLELTYNNGTSKIEEMPLVGQGYWEMIIPVAPDDNIKVRAELLGVDQNGESFEYWTPEWQLSRQGNDAPVVSLAGASNEGTALISAATVDKNVMPVFLPPAISVVDETEESASLASESSAPTKDASVSDAANKNDSFSSKEWMLYAALNIGGIIIIVGGILLYRRLKKSKSYQRDDVNDV